MAKKGDERQVARVVELVEEGKKVRKAVEQVNGTQNQSTARGTTSNVKKGEREQENIKQRDEESRIQSSITKYADKMWLNLLLLSI